MSKKRILVADDSYGMSETLVDILALFDYEVVQVSDGVDAVERVRQGEFNLALLDVQMPRLDGIQALQQIQQIQPALPVLLMTGLPLSTVDEVIGEIRTVEVFPKPLDLQYLLGEIQRLTLVETSTTRVLIVDDELHVCRVLSRRLEQRGYRVEIARSGKQALTMVETTPYDVLFLDVCLPDVSGLELYTYLKRLRPQTVGILMTGYGNDPDVRPLLREAKRKGYVCLEKPFSIERALALVGDVQRGSE